MSAEDQTKLQTIENELIAGHQEYTFNSKMDTRIQKLKDAKEKIDDLILSILLKSDEARANAEKLQQNVNKYSAAKNINSAKLALKRKALRMAAKGKYDKLMYALMERSEILNSTVQKLEKQTRRGTKTAEKVPSSPEAVWNFNAFERNRSAKAKKNNVPNNWVRFNNNVKAPENGNLLNLDSLPHARTPELFPENKPKTILGRYPRPKKNNTKKNNKKSIFKSLKGMFTRSKK
jgi:hypothetical protein